ncbi:hypothetical protein KO361_03640 [Candidatus Woesearchaeota archaeon]|nr:hypothetical protein [Candidatus Woesearchaeota archaeon]
MVAGIILLNAFFGILSVACLVFSLYKLVFIISQYKKYEVVMAKVLELSKDNNSKSFVKANLISEDYAEYVVDDILDEYYSSE